MLYSPDLITTPRNPLTPEPLPQGTVARRFDIRSPFAPGASETNPSGEFASLVLRAVREGWEELREAHPHTFAGMTVCGSTVKGRARETSDVDAFLFISTEGADALQASQNRKPSISPKDTVKLAATQAFKETVGGILSEMGLSDRTADPDQGIYITDKETMAKLAEGYATNSEWCYTNGSPLTWHPKPFVALFMLQVGSGEIPTYRASVINELLRAEQRTPGAGKLGWESVMQALATYEEINRGASLYLPELEVAADYFRIPQELRI